MKPKEKAIELVDKYLENVEDRTGTFLLSNYSAKQCALIAVDEIIHQFTDKCCESANRRFLEEVKQEIEKL